MRSTPDIVRLLGELDRQSAGSLEDQDLDFKQWITRSLKDSVALVVETAVCMANGGGGTVVFGVDDQAVGRAAAILGVPPEVDVMSDRDLLEALGLLRDGKPTVAGLLLAGRSESLAKHLPHYGWSFSLMESDTGYRDRVDDRDPLPVALKRLAERINANNPIATVAVELAPSSEARIHLSGILGLGCSSL